ncbi:uncharacterized protein [Dysidea avara]|uniref:uncharacterized protein n=1 Tax=Dysidea avara TaxID=196820 RepID=UPI0033219AC5
MERFRSIFRYQIWSQLAARLRATNEELIGLNQVLAAQEKAETERKRLEALHEVIVQTKGEIKKVEKEWELFQNQRVSYYQTDDKIKNPLVLQQLNQKEFELTVKRQELQELLETNEQNERSSFKQLSETMWDAHKKEIAQHERVKVYNSFAVTARGLVGLIGAVFGFFGSAWIMRRKVTRLETEVINLKSLTESQITAYSSVTEQFSELQKSVEQCGDKLNDFHGVLVNRQSPSDEEHELIPIEGSGHLPRQQLDHYVMVALAAKVLLLIGISLLRTS